MFSTKYSGFHSDFCELFLERKKREKKDEDINGEFLAWVKNLDKLVKNFSDSYYKAISYSLVSANDKKERVMQINKIECFLKNSIVDEYLNLGEKYDIKNADYVCRSLNDTLKIINDFACKVTSDKFPFLTHEIAALNRIAGRIGEIMKSVDVVNKLKYIPPSSASVASK